MMFIGPPENSYFFTLNWTVADSHEYLEKRGDIRINSFDHQLINTSKSVSN